MDYERAREWYWALSLGGAAQVCYLVVTGALPVLELGRAIWLVVWSALTWWIIGRRVARWLCADRLA